MGWVDSPFGTGGATDGGEAGSVRYFLAELHKMSRWGSDRVWLLLHRLIFPRGPRLERVSDAGMGQFFFRKTAPLMPLTRGNARLLKYIKANNERFSTEVLAMGGQV